MGRGDNMKEYWTIKRVSTGGHLDRSQWFGKDRLQWVKFTSRSAVYSALVTFLDKYWDGGEKFIVVRHTVKPHGAKVGTWAWACEQMVNGYTVWKSAHQTKYWVNITDTMWQMSPEGMQKHAQITIEMIRATSWGRVNP
jgi:hypothetical protein